MGSDVASIFAFEPVRSAFQAVLHLPSSNAVASVFENPPTAERVEEEVVASGLIQANTTTVETYIDGVSSRSTRICIAAPLQYRERVIGALTVRAERETPYSVAEAVAVGNVAKQLVLALESMAKDAAAGGQKELANLAKHVFRLFPNMGNEKGRLTPERAELEDAVRTLSAGLLTNRLNAEWLLEKLPEECRAIASSFEPSDEAAAAADSSQAATLLGKKRAAGLTSEHQRKAATARSAKLSAEERSDIAKAAAAKRWSKEKDGK